MKELGIKKLNQNNWLEPDASLSFSVSDLFDKIYKAKLDDSVPIEIHKLFETARGTMIYGYFFYPIFSFSAEQFTRIAEAAISKACDILDAPKQKTFSEKIKWLTKFPEIKNTSHDRWKSLRELRNKFSHPSKLTIITPYMAIRLMEQIADDINYIFKCTIHIKSAKQKEIF
ncbi:MAG: hypothetical protein HYS25_15420 [Ignavibacteriales bacterium]|nr:hypothetical protein [Ignavibacteriales bacterium]